MMAGPLQPCLAHTPMMAGPAAAGGRVLLLFALLVVVLAAAAESGEEGPTRGHLEPLGSHRDAEPMSEVSGLITGRRFYEEFARANRPFVMRGAVRDMWRDAIRRWSDDAYLLRKASDEVMEIEFFKKEDRAVDKHEWPFKKWIAEAQLPANKGKLYLQSAVPESLYSDLGLPRSYATALMPHHISPLIYMSRGGGQTRSFLHRDQFQNLHCQVAGEKRWLIIDKKYAREVYEGLNYTGWGYRAPFDVDAVYVMDRDLLRFPAFADVPFQVATVKPGDCVYVPRHFYHQVNSGEDGAPTISVSVLFGIPKRFRQKTADMKRASFADSRVWTWQDETDGEPDDILLEAAVLEWQDYDAGGSASDDPVVGNREEAKEEDDDDDEDGFVQEERQVESAKARELREKREDAEMQRMMEAERDSPYGYFDPDHADELNALDKKPEERLEDDDAGEDEEEDEEDEDDPRAATHRKEVEEELAKFDPFRFVDKDEL